MRTKTLLLTAALAAAGAATSMAQSIYSVNAVGYVNKPVYHGFSIIANPFTNVADDTLDTLIGTPPAGQDLITFTENAGGGIDIANFFQADGFWDDFGAVRMKLGAGTVVNNLGATFNVTFVGEVKQSVGGAPIQNSITPGQHLRSSMVPQAGKLDVLGFGAPTIPVTIYQFAPDGVAVNITSWSPADGIWDSVDTTPPDVAIAEGFFVDAFGNSTSWDRVFTVN